MNIDAEISRIRTWRTNANLSRFTLARIAGLHRNTLMYMDRPDWNPSAATIRALQRVISGKSAEHQAA